MVALLGQKSGILAQVNTFLRWEEDANERSEGFNNMTPSFYHFFDILSPHIDNNISSNIKP